MYVSLIPAIQSFSVSYFGIEVYIQQSLLWYFALLALFCACYSAWKDQKNENKKLKQALEISESKFSSFEVRAVFKGVYLDKNYISSLIHEKSKEAKIKLNEAVDEINSLEKVDGRQAAIMSLKVPSISDMFNNINSDDRETLKKSQLLEYKKAMREYLDRLSDCYSEFEQASNKKIKKLYYVDFYIENTSKVFDESIDIDIRLPEEGRFIELNYLINVLPKKLEMPKRKSFAKDDSVVFASKAYSDNSISKLLANQNPAAFYRDFVLEEHGFSLNIKELKSNETVKITRKGFAIKFTENKDMFFSILSKNSGKNITGNVVVNSNEKISFEELILSEKINFLELES